MAISEKPRSLYVHIPFCRSICPYCDFPKVFLATGFAESYLKALLLEDERYAGYRFDTIFVGGGTPSALGPQGLTSLLSTLERRHGKPRELTVECNPEDMDATMCQALADSDCNRVSLGIQTVDDSYLKRLGRRHTFADARNAVERLHAAGLENISADFIYGLPDQTMADIANDLRGVANLRYLTHVSFYALQVEPHTMFWIKGVKTPDSDLLADMYELINRELAQMDYRRYEISNFAKPGFQSKHNLCYWKALPYAAIGLGATSYEDCVREVRTRDIKSYMAGKFVFSRVAENAKTREFTYLMLNLRLVEGFALDEFRARFGKDFLKAYASTLAKTASALDISAGRVKVRPEFLYVLDEILVELLDFKGVL